MCSSAARAIGSTLWPLPFGPPCAAVRGGRSGPAGGIGKDADSFSPGQEPRRKARPPLTNWPAKPASAKWGCPSLWHCHHLGGYFLLGKQEKVTRPPAGGRKPAAGEPGRRHATTEREPKSLDPCFRRGDGVYEKVRRAYIPRPVRQGKKSHPASGGRSEARRPTGTTFGSQRARSPYRGNQKPKAKSQKPKAKVTGPLPPQG